MNTMKIFILMFTSSILLSAQPNLTLPAIFSDNMVLQQNSNIEVWGKGEPKDEIIVKASWNKEALTAVKNDSSWNLTIETPIAGGPYSLLISDGNNSIEYKNVLIGEVWLCSGQSNMEMPLQGWPPNDLILNSANEIANSTNNNIRFFTVTRDISVTPKENCMGEWVESNPQTSANFSATAYFFGKKLYEELKIPIGLIHSSWGGTPAEAWTNEKYLSAIPEFTDDLVKIKESIPENIKLTSWLNQFPKMKMVEKEGENIWANLEFNDNNCYQVDFDHSSWPTMKLPVLWENAELGEFDGAVWFRKKIKLDENWLNRDLRLELGPIDDFDVTYVNGKKVGAIEEEGNWQTPRIYEINERLNNSKELLIAVRVNDNRGGGGICGKPEELKLVKVSDGMEISISGEWHYLPVAEFRGMEYSVFGGVNNTYISRPILPIALSSNTPTLLYNAMISPLVPFSIKGVIWYQGEANTGNPELYERLFPTMISNWRNDFGREFPFYYVQIAPYNYGTETKSEFLRDAQRKTLVLNNTGMVVTLDIGNFNNIHPANKTDVGERLALCALANDYGRDIVFSGPQYISMSIAQNKIILNFDNVGCGLEIKEGNNQFLIAGANKEFVNAEAKVDGSSVIVWSEKIPNPLAVRYAWNNNAIASLFNQEGLPASSFRTDNWSE